MAYWQVFFTIFIGIAVTGLVVSALIYAIASGISYCLDRRQTKILKTLAKSWGFDYRENLHLDTLDSIWQFQFFSYGRNRMITKLIQGQQGDVKILIGDYAYVTGSSSKRRTVYQTVILMQSPRLALPNFMLLPGGRFEQFMFKAFGAFTYHKITFSGHPKFSSRYLLGGMDEVAIRECFQDGVLSFYERQRYTYSEGMGECLFYSLTYRLSPRKWKGLMNTALEAHELFAQRY